jgi:uncharacterized protein YfdQ (DUF2303 family)
MDLERFMDTPKRKVGHIELQDFASFVAFVKAHVQEASCMFVTMSGRGRQNTPPKFTCVFDFHQTAKQGGAPGWCEFSASWQVILLVAAAEWLAHDGEWLSQEAFAEFLEDRRTEVVDPVAAEVVEMASNLQATKTVQFQRGIRLDNGDTQLLYEGETKARAGKAGQLEVPSRLAVRLALYEDATPVEFPARLRYRISDGGELKFRYDFMLLDEMLEQCYHDCRKAVEEATALTILRGKHG